MQTNSYPAKLLLFGEYTIIQRAKALAVPLPNYAGQWISVANSTEKADQEGLIKLLNYLQNDYADKYNTAAFANALEAGENFHSTIPQGYGAGSSGAVTAAVYDRFAFRKTELKTASDLNVLQQELANIESCFHGASSGADPLVCYLKKGVLFNGDTPKLISAKQSTLEGFFLIDTGVSRKTAPFVDLYKKWCEEEMYPLRLEVELIPLVEDAIDAFLKKDKSSLLETIHQIGHFQFKYFAEMLPANFRKPWLDALSSEHTKLKLCGAGGGGFI
ncbi:MAG: mevalonate kinase, partial [Patescibacteria group bacterium]